MEQHGLIQHWEKIFRIQENDFRAKSLEKIIIKLLNKDYEILDLGCGSCGLTLSLLKNGYKVTSVDNSEEMLEMGREILQKNGLSASRVYKSDIASFTDKNKNKFDCLICLDVIEHIKDDHDALLQIHRLIKKGGLLVLSVPAHQNLYGPKDVELGHYRRYSKKDLNNKLRNSGFNVKMIRFWNFTGAIITWMYIKILNKRIAEDFRYKEKSFKTKILKWYFTLFENRIRPPFGLTLLVMAKK